MDNEFCEIFLYLIFFVFFLSRCELESHRVHYGKQRNNLPAAAELAGTAAAVYAGCCSCSPHEGKYDWTKMRVIQYSTSAFCSRAAAEHNSMTSTTASQQQQQQRRAPPTHQPAAKRNYDYEYYAAW